MTQEISSEIIMRPEKFTRTASGDGRVYCKLASLLPVDYFSVVAVENTVGDHEEENLAGDILSMDLSYFDNCPVVRNSGKDEKASTTHLDGANNSVDSNVNRTAFRNRLKVSNTSRTRKNRAVPYKLGNKKTHYDNYNLKSNLSYTNDVEISKKFELDLLTDVMQYMKNLQSLLDRDCEKLNNVQARDMSSKLSGNIIPATSQPQTAMEKTIKSSQNITNLDSAPSEAESSRPSSTNHVKNSPANSNHVGVCTGASRREDASAGLELLEFKTGAITIST